MESKYNYFKRDISWLSFNYRVLLEALDERLPLIRTHQLHLHLFFQPRRVLQKFGWPTIKPLHPVPPKAMKKPYNRPANW